MIVVVTTATQKAGDWRARLDEIIESASDQTRNVREHLHTHPEPSGEEYATTDYLLGLLECPELSTKKGPDGRGLIVQPIENVEIPRIAIRADMDALRIQDAKELPYSSQVDGIMHACGHDGHVAVVLGAVKALTTAANENILPWPVSWRAIFQPAEETNRGALEMVEAGAVDNVSAMLSMHMDPSRPVGSIGVRNGTFTADCVEMRISILGKGGHAARPHESLDPIVAAAQLISSVYLFVPRLSDSHNPVVVSFGEISGGSTPNSIPDEVRLTGTVRTMNAASRKRILEHIRQLARGLAEASDTKIEIEFIEGPPAVENDFGLTKLITEEAASLLGPDGVQDIEKPSMGGEDFANYLGHVRGAMFRLGCAPHTGDAPPLHSALFDIEPEALCIGAKILAQSVVAWSNPKRQGDTA